MGMVQTILWQWRIDGTKAPLSRSILSLYDRGRKNLDYEIEASRGAITAAGLLHMEASPFKQPPSLPIG
jgi:hypothetical protein